MRAAFVIYLAAMICLIVGALAWLALKGLGMIV